MIAGTEHAIYSKEREYEDRDSTGDTHKLHGQITKKGEKTLREVAEFPHKQAKAMRAICAQCKRIRDDEGNWSYKLYNEEQRDTLYTHSLCPKCAKEAIAEIEKTKALKAAQKKSGR